MTIAERLEQKGIEKGIVIGENRGIEKGIKKGILKGKLQTARNMLAEGMDFHTVMRLTHLSEDELQQMKCTSVITKGY
ncbi:TPA: Rpn family recombination-promoting nuclease/putative transposase [Salmonella enterica]|uniref:Rpn family recombination-promoting nuclease/putative transposase n=1 Tax=Salmonella enterica TaxID=28901 RepID=A0A750HZW8_SALER|nr:Rpn family recombination-promoting nuclease/putative transposase [Salmonella enterica]